MCVCVCVLGGGLGGGGGGGVRDSWDGKGEERHGGRTATQVISNQYQWPNQHHKHVDLYHSTTASFKYCVHLDN